MTARELGGEAAMNELITPIMTIAGEWGEGRIPSLWLTTRPTLAHRATGGRGGVLRFPRPLPRGGRTKPATPLDLTGPEARVQRERMASAGPVPGIR